MFKKLQIIGLAAALAACNHTPAEEQSGPPDSSRFVREIFATNLYEPTELVVLPDGKVLFSQRRGAIKLYNPDTEKLTTYDSLPVYYALEDGLMGMALDPEFEQNQWLYLYYSPVGDEAVNQLSRFSYTSSGLTNEKVMLKVPVQREECCHTGGSVEFGSDGLLYLSTGDNTNPFDSEGSSPSDERLGHEYWDAQRSSANTNDLRGKILRIKPEPDGTYSIPAGNLFVDENPATRPEIYVMGCRNPYRIAVDARRGWLYWGDVGPDATNNDDNRGPRGHDEYNVALKSGFFGWPLFVGKNFAYRDYDFATGKGGEYFLADQPMNISPNNTGIQNLPPAMPAKIYYPYASTDIFPQVKTGGRNAMAGPVYYSDMYEGREKFPSFFDGRALFFDWMRGFIYFLEMDEEGNPTDWYRFAENTTFNNIIDMAYGPDGTLYLLEYGTGWFTQNENAQLSRYKYVKGNRPPVLVAEASVTRGAAPLTVIFDASKSYDADGDDLSFKWEIGNEKYADSQVTFTFEKEGVYYPEVWLTDGKGHRERYQYVVEVGNEPPVVKVNLQGNSTFFWKDRSVKYQVLVSDPEDQAAGGVDSSRISFEVLHFQSTDMTEQFGHQTPVADGLALISSLDCKACHKANDVSIGPSYTAVANKYPAGKESISYLSQKIINGGGGVWGEQTMSAHPDLSPADAERIVKYILSLANDKKLPLDGSYKLTEPAGRYLFSASYEDAGKAPLKPIKTVENVWLRGLTMDGDQFSSSHEVLARDGVTSGVYHGSWLAFEQIDLTDIGGISFNVWDALPADISLHLDKPDGTVIGQRPEDASDAGKNELFVALKATSGVHDLYIVFSNPDEKNSLMGISKFNFIPNP